MLKYIITPLLPLLFLSCTKPLHKVTLCGDQSIELQAISLIELSDVQAIHVEESFKSFRKGCQSIKEKSIFYTTCQKITDDSVASTFFEDNFQTYRWEDSHRDKPALMTGYYEPLLFGSLTKDRNHTIPLLAPPNDLIKVYLDSVLPELKGKVVRGRLEGKKVVPYYTRAQITKTKPTDNVICWLEDKVELFFLQVQGSGRIQLDNNETLYVGYGDKNGHPYQSIGQYMIKHKIMSYSQMSLQGIKQWAMKHPDKIDDVLNQNPSYLFFQVNKTPAKGAMGVILTPKHSVAVDTKYIPLGTPMFVQTTHPLSGEYFQSLAIAQDRGAAIKGQRRLDFFWGFGEVAAQLAGHTKSEAEIIIFLPKDYPVN